MLALRFLLIFCLTFVLSLIAIDYVSENALVNMLKKIYNEIESVALDAINNDQPIDMDIDPISISKLFIEIIVIGLTVLIIKKYQPMRGKDRIDELLQHSKEALQQTNEYLEKWKLKQGSSKYSYFDMLPNDLSPLKFEIPVLNMAVIEARNSARNQTERGDADDSINNSDSIVFSITSLIDDDDVTANHYMKDANEEFWSEDLCSLFKNPNPASVEAEELLIKDD